MWQFDNGSCHSLSSFFFCVWFYVCTFFFHINSIPSHFLLAIDSEFDMIYQQQKENIYFWRIIKWIRFWMASGMTRLTSTSTFHYYLWFICLSLVLRDHDSRQINSICVNRSMESNVNSSVSWLQSIANSNPYILLCAIRFNSIKNKALFHPKIYIIQILFDVTPHYRRTFFSLILRYRIDDLRVYVL